MIRLSSGSHLSSPAGVKSTNTCSLSIGSIDRRIGLYTPMWTGLHRDTRSHSIHYHSHHLFFFYLWLQLSSSSPVNIWLEALPWRTCPAPTCVVSPVFLSRSGTCGKRTGGWQLVPLRTCREQSTLTHTDEINATKGTTLQLWAHWVMGDVTMFTASSQSHTVGVCSVCTCCKGDPTRSVAALPPGRRWMLLCWVARLMGHIETSIRH